MPDDPLDHEEILAALDEASGLEGAEFLLSGLRATLDISEAGRSALLDWELGDQTELDVHLAGPGVLDHTTRAEWLGVFMRRSSEAVKELAKEIGGLSRHASRLEVTGPGPGSVRVVFKSPKHVLPGSESETIPNTESESLDSMALHQFASILNQADDIDVSLLDASIASLSGRVRRSVRLAASSVADRGWNIEGTIAARGHGRQPLHLTAAGAARIVEATKIVSTEVGSLTLEGEVDGWIWSKSVMTFGPPNARAFQAVVPPSLQEAVARIVGQPNHTAVATFEVITTFAPGDYSYGTKSYSLIKIDEPPVEDTLPAT